MRAIFAIPVALALVAMGAWMLIDDTIVDSWIQNQQASVSLLQRKLKIGYSRAGRLIDELEALGIISGYSGSKARSVLVDESYIDKIFN